VLADGGDAALQFFQVIFAIVKPDFETLVGLLAEQIAAGRHRGAFDQA
jgi:hypothetical protein